MSIHCLEISLLTKLLIIVLILFSQPDVIEGINKEEFRNILLLATKGSYFTFNEVLYKQNDGVGMGSLLGSTLANPFVCFKKEKGLKNALLYLNQFFIEDMLMIFLIYSNQPIISNIFVTKPNMSFSFEKEKNGKMSFLDVEISRENGKLVTTAYRKPTFSGVYTPSESFLPSKHKYGMLHKHKYGMLHTLVYFYFYLRLLLSMLLLYAQIGQNFIENLWH